MSCPIANFILHLEKNSDGKAKGDPDMNCTVLLAHLHAVRDSFALAACLRGSHILHDSLHRIDWERSEVERPVAGCQLPVTCDEDGDEEMLDNITCTYSRWTG